jgi:hypothetical protein
MIFRFDPLGSSVLLSQQLLLRSRAKTARRYRYYLSQTILKRGAGDCPVARVPAAEIEKIVIGQVRVLLLSPEIIVQTWRSACKSIKGMTESEVRDALQAFDPLWKYAPSGRPPTTLDLWVHA